MTSKLCTLRPLREGFPLTVAVFPRQADKQQKEEIKNVSLGTSKINYNDPRITVAWCKLHDVPIQARLQA
eukprot:2027663-Pleurochrysis_carterae.AAC.7